MQAQGIRWLGSNRIVTAAIGVGLLAAALVMPAASAQGAATGTSMSRDTCLLLEQNIADYDCDVPLAEYADVTVRLVLPQAPDGVDWLLWEQNVLDYADSGATFEGEEDPQSLFPEADDVEQLASGAVSY